MSYPKIIDVSTHNGNVNYEKVKKAGIAGVIIRAGYGMNHIDAKFISNVKGAIAAGLPVGVYWFSYAYTASQAIKEAEYCIAAIKPYKITLPVFFDWEYDSMRYAKKQGVAPGKTLITAMAKAFCQKVEAAGYTAGVYYNLDYLRNYIDMAGIRKYKQWLAQYSLTRSYDCDLWQYTSGGSVSGVSGRCDVNYLVDEDLLKASHKADNALDKYTDSQLADMVINGDFGSGDARKKALGDRYDKVQDLVNKKLSKKSVTEIAKEVIAGKWGNGAERKRRLTQAGYDPAAVQKKVNELLK